MPGAGGQGAGKPSAKDAGKNVIGGVSCGGGGEGSFPNSARQWKGGREGINKLIVLLVQLFMLSYLPPDC